ncbi:MAG: glycoside hydrolase family 2 TIM barrel-domain containing protein [Oscillospiraceae bacterium]
MRKTININDGWKFLKETFNQITLPIKMLKDGAYVNLPYATKGVNFRGVNISHSTKSCIYEKTIYVDAKPNEDVYIEFLGANFLATIYANGKEVGSHSGGFSTFRMNLSQYIIGHRLHLLVVVENDKNDYNGSKISACSNAFGVHRDVNLIIVQKEHFALSYFGTSGISIVPYVNEDGSADVSVTAISQNTNDCGVRLTLDNQVKMLDAMNASATFHIENPTLWNGTKNPFLYTVTAELIKDGYVIDKISESFGVRSFYVDTDAGFFLNNKSYPLNGLDESKKAKVDLLTMKNDEIENYVKSLISSGINYVSTFSHNQYFYELCDKYGICVCGKILFLSSEIANEDEKEKIVNETREIILQNYNHPSIICWETGNENLQKNAKEKNAETLKEVNFLCHRLDKSRLIIMNNK